MTEWSAFFEVQAGVAASLTGLIFVGLSISFTRIIGSPHLPNRALEALLLLLLNVTIASLALVPGETPSALAGKVLIFTTLLWAVVAALHLRSLRGIARAERVRPLIAMGAGQLVWISWWVGGGLLLARGGAGLAALEASFIFGYLLAMLNAWVLLVEIHR
jgi:modulator of FtsH protease